MVFTTHSELDLTAQHTHIEKNEEKKLNSIIYTANICQLRVTHIQTLTETDRHLLAYPYYHLHQSIYVYVRCMYDTLTES